MVDKSLISKKLERIESYLKQIRQKKDPGIALFLKDRDLQSIILFNLIQLIQACVDIGAHIISDSGWEAPQRRLIYLKYLQIIKLSQNLLQQR
ncbi:MAG: DUF86 domain-containing protein [Nitrospirae bacterium]|nr:DUF86 domain-containing protein [Nitrospirota bacterium]